MSIDNPRVEQLRRDEPIKPEKCPSCLGPIDPHSAECRCS